MEEDRKAVSAMSGRLRLYLFTGHDGPYKYVAGSCESPSPPEAELISKAVMTADAILAAVDVLKEANENGSHVGTTLHALAAIVSAIPDKPDFVTARKQLYKLTPVILSDTKRLMLFNKYAISLKIAKKSCWQQCMRGWYAECDHDKLTGMILNDRHFGWCHKDILRLLHSPGVNDVHKLFCKYSFGGIEAAIKMENLQGNVIKQLTAIDKFKTAEKPNDIADVARENAFFKYQHFPQSVLFAKNTPYALWKVIIDRMSIDDIMSDLIQIVPIVRLLKYRKPAKKNSNTSRGLSKINEIILNSTTCPIRAYLTYANFKESSRKSRKKAIINKTQLPANIKKEEEEAEVLENSLLSLVDKSFQAMECKIEAKCLIILDLRRHMFTSSKTIKDEELNTNELSADINNISPKHADIKSTKNEEPDISKLNADLKNLTIKNAESENIDKPAEGTVEDPANLLATVSEDENKAKCFNAKNVTPGHAAILLALYLTKCMRETSVAVYGKKGIITTSLVDENMKVLSLEDAKNKLRSLSFGQIRPSLPIRQASEKQMDIDLFVNVIDTYARIKENPKIMVQEFSDVRGELEQYRDKMKKPNAKAVTISLCCRDVSAVNNQDGSILDIAGFDENVPKIITNFAAGII